MRRDVMVNVNEALVLTGNGGLEGVTQLEYLTLVAGGESLRFGRGCREIERILYDFVPLPRPVREGTKEKQADRAARADPVDEHLAALAEWQSLMA
jgi:hypothetical protein